MKRFALLALLLVPTVADAQWKEGFNFRDTLAYCTDPTDSQIACYTSGVGCDSPYPTTAGGVTFGANNNSGDNKRDRDAGIDCRLAGISFQQNNSASKNDFRVDLPASGVYNFRLAMGSGGGFSAGANQKMEVYDSDDATVLLTVTDASVAADHWVDAGGTERTSASDWVTNNASVQLTFSGTAAYIKWGYGDGSTSGNTCMSHFELEQVATDILPQLQAIGEE